MQMLISTKCTAELSTRKWEWANTEITLDNMPMIALMPVY